MLTFSRLTADGEYIALQAFGYSFKKVLAPVFGLALLLYFVSAFCGLNFEAWGRRQFELFIYEKTQTEIDNMIRFKIQEGVFVKDFLNYVFYTEKISNDRINYKNVIISPSPNSLENHFVMMAPSAKIEGAVKDGNLRMTFYDGLSLSYKNEEDESAILKFESAEIDLLRVFQERILGKSGYQGDYRSYPMSELALYIDDLKQSFPEQEYVYYRARYLLHARAANSLLVLTFALLGAVLGLFDVRQAKNSGYMGCILAIIISYIVVAAFRWLAEYGHMDALLAAWLPQILMFLFASFMVYQKNRLPISEGIFSRKNLPGSHLI